ncbi:hypothetical protein H2200_010310 [Cladophialophora chaetospira]|uniref:DUF7587 domain-containing protein n=1 Tax=Cladophialophora chaetospira TaxID=386627 RepID=A0AA38X176_9EURO|nr:hypothetical protein H2200_010310 [Cladophialophora chaetospira]
MSPFTPPRKAQYGRKNPQIIKDDGEWKLIANQLQSGLSREVRSGAKPVCVREVTGGDHKIRPYRYNVFVSEHQDFESSEWTFSHHRIDMQGVLAATHANCPRLLFRVFSDQSMGLNTGGCFGSEAFKRNKEFTSMESMTEIELRDNLTGHINGRKKGFVSHWISFTMSLLFALGLAHDMKCRKHTNISIAIVNTLELPNPLQVFAAEPLMLALGVGEMKMKNLAATEFVAWDKVDIPGTVISLEKFLKVYHIKNGYIKHGYPGLNPSVFRPLHHKPIKKLREDLGKAVSEMRLRPPSELRRSNYTDDDILDTLYKGRKAQSPITEREVYEIWRKFYGKKVNNKLTFKKRIPIDHHTLRNFYESVEETFPDNIRFDMLNALLSFRIDHFEPSSIVERFEEMLDVNHPMLNGNGKRYQCYVRDAPTPTLPEIDAYEGLLENVCKVIGIKVNRLSSLPQPRNFKTLEVSYTTLPMFDDAAEDRAKDCLERAKQAFMRREAKRKIEEEERQKKERYEENRRRARERKALMGSALFQISSEKQKDAVPVPDPTKSLVPEVTGTPAEVDDAEGAEIDYDVWSSAEEDCEGEEKEECDNIDDQESSEKAILEVGSGLTGLAHTEWGISDPLIEPCENFKQADFSKHSDPLASQLTSAASTSRKRLADTHALSPNKKGKLTLDANPTQDNHHHDSMSSVTLFSSCNGAEAVTVDRTNIVLSSVKLQFNPPNQSNMAYHTFQANPFFKSGGHQNVDYGPNTSQRRTPPVDEKHDEAIDLESDEVRALLAKAYHENSYFK